MSFVLKTTKQSLSYFDLCYYLQLVFWHYFITSRENRSMLTNNNSFLWWTFGFTYLFFGLLLKQNTNNNSMTYRNKKLLHICTVRRFFYLALLSLPSLRVFHLYLGILPHHLGRSVLYSCPDIGQSSEARPGSPAHNNPPWSKTLELIIDI